MRHMDIYEEEYAYLTEIKMVAGVRKLADALKILCDGRVNPTEKRQPNNTLK